MKIKSIICIVAVLLLAINLQAQFTDNFNYDDFTANPVWIGNSADWVNTSFQLQSNNTVANSSFYFSTARSMAISTQWELYVGIGVNTSSANYADIFLAASGSNLLSNNITGYFVRIGNTNDEICIAKMQEAQTRK